MPVGFLEKFRLLELGRFDLVIQFVTLFGMVSENVTLLRGESWPPTFGDEIWSRLESPGRWCFVSSSVCVCFFFGGFQSFWESFCIKQNLGKTGNCTNQNDTWNHKDHQKLEVYVCLYSQWLVGGFSPTHLNISKWVHLPHQVKTHIWNHLDPKSSMEYLPTFTINLSHSWIDTYTVRPVKHFGDESCDRWP